MHETSRRGKCADRERIPVRPGLRDGSEGNCRPVGTEIPFGAVVTFQRSTELVVTKRVTLKRSLLHCINFISIKSHIQKPALTRSGRAAHRVSGRVASLQDHAPFGTPAGAETSPSVSFLRLLPRSPAAGRRQKVALGVARSGAISPSCIWGALCAVIRDPTRCLRLSGSCPSLTPLSPGPQAAQMSPPSVSLGRS